MNGFWGRVAGVVRRRSWSVLAGAGLVTVALAAGLPLLRFSSGQDTFVASGSRVYRDNLVYQREFGGEPVLVLFTGDVRSLFEPQNAVLLEELEDELLATGRYHSVLSPLTAVRFAAAQVPLAVQLAPAALLREREAAAGAARESVEAAGGSPEEQEEAARRARERVEAEFAEQTAADATRLADVGDLVPENPAFVEFALFDEEGGIRPELARQFPDAEHALMVVRLNGNMTLDEQSDAAQDVVDAVERRPFENVAALPTGPAILLREVNDGMREAMGRMGLVAAAVMGLILVAVLRVRWRLLSLGVVAVGIVWAFGAMGYVGLDLTMVTISSLPVLIGMGIDFAIQIHSRFEEEAAGPSGVDDEVRRTLVPMGPALTVAMVAAVAGFLAVRFSAVPMIRDYGTMLALGVAVLYVAGIVIPSAVLCLRDRRRHRPPPPGRSSVERVVRLLTRVARGHVLTVVVVGVVVTTAGLALERRTTTTSDPETFVPQDSPVLADLRHVRDVSGSSQELGFMVRAPDVTRPEILEWIREFEATALERYPDRLLSSSSIAGITFQVTRASPTASDVESVVAVAPEVIPASFLSDDRTAAHVLFPLAPIPLLDQKALLDEIDADLESDLAPPPGVTVTPGGLAVIGIESVDALDSNRTLMVYVALGAALLWLLVFTRSFTWALLPLLPVLIAVGTSAIAIYYLGVELSPLSAVSGPVIVATCTEFSVLVMARYVEERERGRGPRDALDRASLRIGQAFVASGLTTVGGFAALALSGFPLLDSFGVVVAVNVCVALVSSLVVLPPLLAWADERVGMRRVERRLHMVSDG